MLYGKTPEAYLGLSVHDKGWIARVGMDVVSISPRQQGDALDANGNPIMNTAGKPVQIKVNDRLTTVSPFAYLQYKKGEFSFKAKTIFAQAGEHMNLDGGYGVTKVNADGSYKYTPIRTSSSWISLVYGGKVGSQEDKHPQKLQGILFAGYIKSFGTKDAIYDPNGDGIVNEKTADGESWLYFYTARPNNTNQLWRLSPTLLYTVGKFQLGLEYEITSVQYGKGINAAKGLADKDLHWVTNHRVQLMTKYNF